VNALYKYRYPCGQSVTAFVGSGVTYARLQAFADDAHRDRCHVCRRHDTVLVYSEGDYYLALGLRALADLVDARGGTAQHYVWGEDVQSVARRIGVTYFNGG